ncbi:MAG: host-nuclease inhibitor Gam family protein [Kiritimatiellia bacterium]
MAIELQDDYQQYNDEQHQDTRFRVSDDSGAEWALRKIAQYKAETQQRAAFVDAEMERMSAWQKHRDEQDKAQIEHFEALLNGYYNALSDAGKLGKKKFYSLPSGKFGTRHAAPSYKRDDKALLAWANDNAPEVVESVPKLIWTELKDRLKITEDMKAIDTVTGCIVDGVQVAEPERDVFSVSTIDGGE